MQERNRARTEIPTGTWAGWLAIVLIVVACIATAEWAAGSWRDTASIRDQARMFRSEAAFLLTFTKNLVPEIDHAYPGAGMKERRFRTASDGSVRGPDDPRTGSTTILFLGGSTTECNEVDEESRFPVVVQNLLRDAGISTTNGGVRGHTTQDSINALLNRPAFRDADLVVLMHNINDRLWLASRGGYDAMLGRDSPTSFGAVRGAGRAFAAALWDFLSYRSNTLFLARTAAGRFDAWTGESNNLDVTEDSIDFGAEKSAPLRVLFEQNLRLFVGIARGLGQRPILMTQPLGVDSPEQAAFNESIRAVAAEVAVPLVDLDVGLGAEKNWAFLSDDIHLNNQGSVAVGKIIARELAPLVNASPYESDQDKGFVSIERFRERCGSEAGDPNPSAPEQIIGEQGRYPSFSPDGMQILFHSWDRGRDRLKVWDARLGRQFELSSDRTPINERHPAFGEFRDDGFDVIFGSGFEEETRTSLERLMVREWPEMTTRPLIDDPDLGGAIPAVRGGMVVFPGFRARGEERIPDLYLFELASKSLKRLTKTTWEEWRPAIGQDGSVYYIANPGGQFDVFNIDPRSGESRRVLGSEDDEWDPSISPDGEWIAFASRRDGDFDIFLARLNDPSRWFKLTDDAGDEWDPSWDPSARLIAYGAHGDGGAVIKARCVWNR